MREIKTIEVDRWVPGESKGMVKHDGMISPQAAFDELEKHLKEADLMPDEYFSPNTWDWGNAKELPNYSKAVCNVNWGGSEGIYLDVSLLYYNEKDELKHFYLATGKTLGESGDDYLRMSRIAAECSMMLNGRGEIVRFYEDEKGIDKNLFKVGDFVKIPYISDRNPHNNQVGIISWLHDHNYYPNGDYSVVEKKTQGIITYEDGSEESVSDFYREGSGLVSKIIKVKDGSSVEEKAALYDKAYTKLNDFMRYMKDVSGWAHPKFEKKFRKCMEECGMILSEKKESLEEKMVAAKGQVDKSAEVHKESEKERG